MQTTTNYDNRILRAKLNKAISSHLSTQFGGEVEWTLTFPGQASLASTDKATLDAAIAWLVEQGFICDVQSPEFLEAHSDMPATWECLFTIDYSDNGIINIGKA